MDQIHKKLAELLRIKTGVQPTGEQPLAALHIDSLAMAEITLEVEGTFGIKIDEDILDVVTVNDLAEYIYARGQNRSDQNIESN